jgi:hypothetical protein
MFRGTLETVLSYFGDSPAPCDRQRVRNLGIGWIIAVVAELRSA